MRRLEYGVRINPSGTIRCEPTWSWHPPPASMDDFDLWFVWAGRGTLRWNRETFDVLPGSLFLLRPGEEYHGEQDPLNRLGVCYIHFDFLDARGCVVRPGERDLPPRRCHVDDEIEFYERVLRQVALLWEADDALGRNQAERLLQSVLLGMRRTATGPQKSRDADATVTPRAAVIASITRHVRENPGELFNVDALARRAGYSVDHFTRLFSSIMSMTPKEFCIRVRIDRARQLLRESEMGVEEIARALGYADVFFFSRQFKQRVGESPTAWRAGLS